MIDVSLASIVLSPTTSVESVQDRARLVCWFTSCPSLSLRRWPMPPQSPKKNCPAPTEGPQSAYRMEMTLTHLVVCPVQIVVEVNAQVFVLLQDLHVQTLHVHRCTLGRPSF